MILLFSMLGKAAFACYMSAFQAAVKTKSKCEKMCFSQTNKQTNPVLQEVIILPSKS